jgi:hypothetical protein
MGASSATPVEKLRDKEYQEKNGHTSSIMDYARFNYVAQPEDGVTALFLELETMTNGQLNGVFYFEDTKEQTQEKVVEQK